MIDDMNSIKLKEHLLQSQCFGDQLYSSMSRTEDTFDSHSIASDISTLRKRIDIDYHLTSFQKRILDNIFISFREIKKIIDPNHLTPFNYSYNNEEDEFLLYRSSNEGGTNIIIHENKVLAFSFIGINSDEKDELSFYEEDNVDFEKLAYSFFAF